MATSQAATWSAPCASFSLLVSLLLYIFGYLVRNEGNWTFDIIVSRHDWDRQKKAQCCDAAGRAYLCLSLLLWVTYYLSARRQRRPGRERTSDRRSGDGYSATSSDVDDAHDESPRVSRRAVYGSGLRGRLNTIRTVLSHWFRRGYNAARGAVGYAPVPPPPRSRSSAALVNGGGSSSARRNQSTGEMDRLNAVSAESTRPSTPVASRIDPVGRLRAWLQRGAGDSGGGGGQRGGERVGPRTMARVPPGGGFAGPTTQAMAVLPGHAHRDVGRGRRRRVQNTTAGESVAVNSPLSQGPPTSPSTTLPFVAAAPVEDLFVLPPQSPNDAP